MTADKMLLPPRAVNPAAPLPGSHLAKRLSILETGITQPELDRALVEMRSSFQQRAESAATRPSRAIVNSIIQQMDDNERRHYLSESMFLNIVSYENERLGAYVKKLTKK